jgi:hypothetical protein
VPIRGEILNLAAAGDAAKNGRQSDSQSNGFR